ncbi:MAG: hypothetical protein ACSLE1_21685 [Sphingobium sp.]
MYQFSYDPEKILVRLTQQGYWTMPVFRAYEAEFLKLHASIRRRNNNYRVLADCREFPIQSAEIGIAFSVMFEKLMAENPGRYAILVGSTLNKLQAKRAIPHPQVQAFMDPDEAMTWLFGDSGCAI